MAAPVFDAFAISAQSGGIVSPASITESWSHAVGAGANNCGIVACVESNGGAGGFVPTGSPTASIGGTSLSYLGYELLDVTVGGFIAVWAFKNVPVGPTQTVNMNVPNGSNNASNAFGVSFTYLGVGGIGALQSALGSSSANGVTVPSALGHTVWGLLANYSGGTYASPSFNQRMSNVAAAPFCVAGDQAGAGSVNFNATQAAAFPWGAVALDLLPVPVTPRNNNINQAVRRGSLF
jgi:hypothetical protein